MYEFKITVRKLICLSLSGLFDNKFKGAATVITLIEIFLPWGWIFTERNLMIFHPVLSYSQWFEHLWISYKVFASCSGLISIVTTPGTRFRKLCRESWLKSCAYTLFSFISQSCTQKLLRNSPGELSSVSGFNVAADRCKLIGHLIRYISTICCNSIHGICHKFYLYKVYNVQFLLPLSEMWKFCYIYWGHSGDDVLGCNIFRGVSDKLWPQC